MVSIMVTIRSLLNIIKSKNENIKLTPGEFSRRPAMQGGGVIFETPSPLFNYVGLCPLILKGSSPAFELSCKYS